MKTALFLFLSILALTAFSQSKKATNKLLLQKHEQLVNKNDSLAEVIIVNHEKLTELGISSSRTSRNLINRRMEFTAIKGNLATIQKKLAELGPNPDMPTMQEELDAIYARHNETYEQKEVTEFRIGRQPFSINRIGDISHEKLKVQNDLLARKNQEYFLAIDSNLRIIEQQEMLKSNTNTAIQKMESESLILTKDNRLLKEKYELLRSKCSELELKKEEAEIAAENAKLEKLAKAVPNKKKKKTVRFVPPVIIDEEWYYPSERHVNESGCPVKEPVYYSPDPVPIVREEKIALQEPVILEIVEEPAEFPGGIDALKKYLADHIVYPESAKEAGISGKVYLKFVVSDQGNISNVKVMRGIPGCPECDREATRVVKAMPKWTPGKNRGKTVSMYYNFPISFKLSDK